MKKNSILLTYILLATLLGCQQNPNEGTEQNTFEADEIVSEPQKNGITTSAIDMCDTAQVFASIGINEEQGVSEIQFRNIEYSEASLLHEGKLISTIQKETKDIFRVVGAEGQRCLITVDFLDRKNGNLIKSISEPADEIAFHSHYYSISHWGCCGAETEGTLKNLETGNEIVSYTSQFFSAWIPNSKLKLFWGYRPEERQVNNSTYELNMGLIVGRLYFANLNGVINEVVIHASDEKSYQSILHWTPEIQFEDSKIDKINKTEIRLWSHNHAELQKDINGSPIEVIIINENELGVSDTLTYEIVDGYLEGSTCRILHDTVFFQAPNNK